MCPRAPANTCQPYACTTQSFLSALRFDHKSLPQRDLGAFDSPIRYADYARPCITSSRTAFQPLSCSHAAARYGTPVHIAGFGCMVPFLAHFLWACGRPCCVLLAVSGHWDVQNCCSTRTRLLQEIHHDALGPLASLRSATQFCPFTATVFGAI